MNDILSELTQLKSKLINDFIIDFLGHEPNAEERKQFKINQSLHECSVYFKGELIKVFTIEVKDDNDLWEG